MQLTLDTWVHVTSFFCRSQYGKKFTAFASSDMVSWFAQTAKELFRHLTLCKDNLHLSGMRGEVFL